MNSFEPRRAVPPLLFFSAAAMIVIAAATWSFGAQDMDLYFLPWFDHIRSTGPVGAFASPFSNYAPPYLYLFALASPLGEVLEAWDVIKLVFFFGHFLLIAALAQLLRIQGIARPWGWAALIGLAPTLIANPAVIGQCDAYWAAALVMALTEAMRRRNVRMFAWCGLAVGLKLQAAFLGPFFLALALSRGIPLRLWFVAPVGYAATLIPAAIAGWPVADLLTIYLRQAGWSEALALNAPNIWMLVQTFDLPIPAVLATMAAALGSLGYLAYFWRRLEIDDGPLLLRAACACALLLPGLLPRMHERYFFMAEVLTLALAVVVPREWRAAALAQLGTCLGILAYFTGEERLAAFGALFMLAASWLIFRGLFLRREGANQSMGFGRKGTSLVQTKL